MRKLILAAGAAATLMMPAIASAHLNARGPAKVPVHVCVAKHGHKARLAKHCTRNERGITIWLKAIPGPHRVRGVQGPSGKNGTDGTNGTNGTKGADGTNGTNGVNGNDGAQGAQGLQGQTGTNGTNGSNGSNGRDGARGPQGVSSPWTYSYTGGHTPDTNVRGNDWANDTFNTQFQVIPQEDGSYLIVKSITGWFTTIAGASGPNDYSGNSVQTGGVTGTMTGVEQWTVPAGAMFDPTATPDLDGMQGNEAQNKAFTAAFFSTVDSNGVATPVVYTGVGNGGNDYDFVYHSGTQTMVQSGAPNGNAGDITNG